MGWSDEMYNKIEVSDLNLRELLEDYNNIGLSVLNGQVFVHQEGMA